MAAMTVTTIGPRPRRQARPSGRPLPLLSFLLLTAFTVASSASIRIPRQGQGHGCGSGTSGSAGDGYGCDTLPPLLLGRRSRGGGSSTIPRSTAPRSSISDPADPTSSASGTSSGGSPTASSSSAPASPRQRQPQHPPWNPSAQIDDDGFLRSTYTLLPGEWEPEASIGGRHGPTSRRYRSLHRIPTTVRQVPGDGNCLFHSIATGLAHAVNGTHLSMKDTALLRINSALLRSAAVDCLGRDPKRRLFLQGAECLRAGELVSAAAAQYDLTGEEYCDQMGRDGYWGGGPEIVALCNVLRRPIHVYELCSDAVLPDSEDVGADEDEDGKQQLRGKKPPTNLSPPQFRLRRMACFGSPRFDRREPISILSADSRFPDVSPGRQLGTGNHFLALFPDPREVGSGKSPRRVRGGGASGSATGSGSARRRSGAAGSEGGRWKVRPSDGLGLDGEEEEGSRSIWSRCVDRMVRMLDY